MAVKIHRDLWKPVGVNGLEAAAREAVRLSENTLIVAGPGAGKTELLAQRACYLLQTGLCPAPKQILAISFKRDAARNLRERVRQRCGVELVSRFYSYTFDAFAKGLVDRFGEALPVEYRPSRNYRITFELNPRQVGQFIREELPFTGSALDDAARNSINGERMYKTHFIGAPLTPTMWQADGVEPIAAAELWRYMLKGGRASTLNFNMVGRLAELVLRSNPKILMALRAAYAFVFLDEFQDTSGIHYDLTRTAFCGSSSAIMAVGDNKQRVNKWAGALEGIFDIYESDFGAKRIHLRLNYRSAKELVTIQAHFAAAIDEKAPPAEPADSDNPVPGECRALLFASHTKEAAHLAGMIHDWITKDKLKPRQICVLCRQLPRAYGDLLLVELAKRGISSRVENELQDMLAEPLSEYLLHVLRLTCRPQAAASWTAICDILCELTDCSTSARERKEMNKLSRFLNDLSSAVVNLAPTEEAVRTLCSSIVGFLGESAFRAIFPQYAQGEFYDKALSDLAKEIAARLPNRTLLEAIDDLEGIDSVPIMTMHKSKGLEYHTIVFVGLEDSALWGFRNEPTEETCGFFVALSRAIGRAVFTFSDTRPDRNGRIRNQTRTEIGRLYQLLENAGVIPEEIA